jgi:hypothetical protein
VEVIKLTWDLKVVVGCTNFGVVFGVLDSWYVVGMGIVLAMGTIALVTGALGFCPLWSLFGINTCSIGSAKKS